MRVALFGGSFNPPHVAHQMVALYVLETTPVNELWFVPAFQHAFDKPLEAFADRHRMCELAASALGPRARVSDIEARLGGPSRTLKTVEKLIQEHPDTAFSLVVGSDLVSEIDTWYGAATLRQLVPFIIVGRGGGDASVQMPAISSTEIRAALEAGRDATSWVPKSVLDYITSRGLYGSRQTP
ncbi:MAG: nicotinate (nicotinamide) nucleotide adenylyltransferase [Deltaproteobacteria bacterium]|nr:nicotinate (nicotinamide) nucleotide adenylyltransferase [Deltaproteobacteria bacterium]